MPQNVADSMANSALGYDEMMTYPEMPFWAKALENIPAASAAAGNYGRRGSNTIMRGPRGGPVASFANRGIESTSFRGSIGQSIKQNIRPFARFSRSDHLAGAGYSGAYRPFFFGDSVNAIDRQLRGQGRSSIGQRLNKYAPLQAKDEALWSGGAYSRLSAAGKIGNMSDASFAKYQGNVTNFLGQMGYSPDRAARMAGNRSTAQRALLTGGGGRITGRIGGFAAAAGTEGGMATAQGVRDLLDDGGKFFAHQAYGETGSRGMALAASWADDIGLKGARTARVGNIAGQASRTAQAAVQAGRYGRAAAAVGKGAALGGARVGLMAVPGVNIAMTAWMAYDLSKLAVQATGYAMKTAGEAHKSFRGNFSRGPMDTNFVDTTASATARARGVQAIQASKLNARSVLGSEASAMSGHFG